MKGQIFIALCCFIFFNIISCKNDPDLTGVPQISFKDNIAPILSTKCTFSGCHGSNNRAFSLASYEDVMASGSINAGNANTSSFYKSITNRGEKPMPPDSYSKLTNEQINLVYVWIEQGALNN